MHENCICRTDNVQREVESWFVEGGLVPAVTCRAFFRPVQTAAWTVTSCAGTRWHSSARRTPERPAPSTVRHWAPRPLPRATRRVGWVDSVHSRCMMSHLSHTQCQSSHLLKRLFSSYMRHLQYADIYSYLTWDQSFGSCANWWQRVHRLFFFHPQSTAISSNHCLPHCRKSEKSQFP